MANNCSDGVYNLEYTDNTKNPIVVNKKTLIQDVLDITLLGKSRKEYGQEFNENILHMLENFSCPEDANNPGNPDLDQTYANLLEQPTEGQVWYNSTQLRIYVYDGSGWIATSLLSDIAGNSGIIAHGEYMPKPVSTITGYEFSYDECSWVVSPFNFPDEVDYMTCYTDSTGLVNSQYRLSHDATITDGYAFYQIIGIRNNNSEGDNNGTVPPVPSPTPSPTTLPNPSVSVGASPTPQVTPTGSPGLSVTPTPERTPTPSPTPSATRTATPAATTTPTPTRTRTPTPTPSITPSKSIKPLTATLYIAPSKGYPEGSFTEIMSPCLTYSNDIQGCQAHIGVVIQQISGGSPPYTVDFSNLIFNSRLVDQTTAEQISTTVSKSYNGASGTSTSALRTGVTSTSSVSAYGIINVTGTFNGCSAGNWSLGFTNGSYVLIKDSQNRSIKLYTPTGGQGNVYGSSYTTAQGGYIDGWYSSPQCGTTGGGGCVEINSVFPDGKYAKDTTVDQPLLTSDPYNYFESGLDIVSYSEAKLQPCVRIKTESGATLVCSTTAPIPTYDNGYMLAPMLQDRKVPVMRNNITNWETIVKVEHIGDRMVQHITVGDKCFWAGETEDAFILHHNKLAPANEAI